MTEQPNRDTRAASHNASPDEPTYLIHSYEHRAYPLDDEHSFTIGRDSRCNIMVSEVGVSRQHAELRPDSGRHVLHPVGSTPTYLNANPLETPRPLRSGDTITIGTMRFVFVSGQLPVAITVAPPVNRMVGVNEHMSDRRPTLTFPVQLVPPPTPQRERRIWPWVALVILLFVVGLALLDHFHIVK